MAAVFIGSSLRLAMPLALAATGELVSERAGVLNMSVEGMMLIGAFGGAIGAWATGSPMLGLAIGVLAALPVALLQAWLSITLRANQIVTGIGINILVLGGTTMAYREILGRHSRTEIPGLAKWAPPGLGTSRCSAMRCFARPGCCTPDLCVIAVVAWVMRDTAIGLAVRRSVPSRARSTSPACRSRGCATARCCSPA